jgi:hypothetical protein
MFTAALLLFLLTKNIASAGAVTVDRFEYWICGLVPVMAYYGLERLEISSRTGLKGVFLIGLTAWLLTLVAYLLLQLTFLSEVVEFPIQEKFGYASPISTAIVSGVYVSFGSLGTLLLRIKSYKADATAHFVGAALAFALNWVLFFILVFAL